MATSVIDTTTQGRQSSMRRQEFLASVVDRLRRELPEELAEFHVKSMSSLVKIFYGNERVHYEVMTMASRQAMEIGLHFEDGPVSTAAYLAYFDDFIVELKHQLGPTIELERWTETWGHIFEVEQMPVLTDGQCARTAKRLAELIAVLQPLVDAAGIPAERSVDSQEYRGRWRGKWRR